MVLKVFFSLFIQEPWSVLSIQIDGQENISSISIFQHFQLVQFANLGVHVQCILETIFLTDSLTQFSPHEQLSS